MAAWPCLFADSKGSWSTARVVLLLYASAPPYSSIICICWQPLVPNLLENVNGVAQNPFKLLLYALYYEFNETVEVGKLPRHTGLFVPTVPMGDRYIEYRRHMLEDTLTNAGKIVNVRNSHKKYYLFCNLFI